MAIDASRFYESAPRTEWVLTFEGALAHYVCTDPLARVEFARQVVTAAGGELSPDLELRNGGVTIRLAATFEAGGLPDAAADVAPRISAVAKELGLTADTAHLQSIQIAVDGGSGAVPFWQAVTGYERPEDADLIDPLRRAPGVWNQAVNDDREAAARLHIDISVSKAEAPRRIEAALKAGGRVVDDRFAPQWTTLADPDGNLVDIAAWPDLP